MKSKLIKNLSLTFLANAISLIVSVVGTLVIPKLMGVTEYGYWQLFLFYISYAGLLHLGLCDGVYLAYGGEEYESLDFESLRSQFLSLALYSCLFCIIISIGAMLFTKDYNVSKVFVLTCIGAFVHVIKTFIIMIMQTTNRLVEYSFVTIIDRVVFIVSVITICLLHIVSYENMIICDIIGRVVSLVIAVVLAKELVFGKYRFDKGVFHDLASNIRSGSKLLIAGIAGNFIIGFIRIGVQNKWSIVAFGKLSLSLSIINMVLSFINMASIVFFPILKQMSKESQITLFKKADYVLCFSTFFVLLFAGIGSKLISAWLPQYTESAYYLILLLPVCIFESETSMLLNTYLKALRKEGKLLLVNIITMLLSILMAFASTVLFDSVFAALLSIDVLVLFRSITLKEVLQNSLDGTKQPILMSIVLLLLFVYLFLYVNFSVVFASIGYVIVYSICLLVCRKQLKDSFRIIVKA